MKPSRSNAGEMPVLAFPTLRSWSAWLDAHHGASPGVWLRLAKKGCAIALINHREALEEALCYGWIDGQLKPESETTWRVKFTPRRNKSIWSKINRAKALALIESGRMKPAGLKEVERAKADGRWDAAYDSPSTAIVPPDLQKALNGNARAKAFFSTLDGANRYAVLWRIQTAKKPETRSRRIREFVAMLARREKLHP
jgi:uncharacterized protein YdeI (YjbR/CyaY-like superfamily)